MAKYSSERECREAFEKWLSENSKMTVNVVPVGEIVKISNGKEIKLGTGISNRRTELKKGRLKGEKYKYWVEKQGLSIENRADKKNNEAELELREALEKWLSENKGKTVNDVAQREKVRVLGGKKINLGSGINSRKQALKNKQLKDEKYKYWVEKQGLSIENQLENKWNKEELEVREAFEKWLSENKEKTVNDVPSEEKTQISSGKEINLGSCIYIRKQALKNKQLKDEKYEYWVEKQGLSIENRFDKKNNEAESELREALEKWLSENPGKTVNDVAQSEKVKISSGKEINLGIGISKRKVVLKNEQLKEEKYEYWVGKHGLSADGKRKNNSKSKQTTLDKYTELYNGDVEKAKRVVYCLNSLKEKRKSKRKEEWNIDNILEYFNVDIEILEKYLNKTITEKVPRDKVLEYEGMSLKEYCIQNGYNYDVVLRTVKLKQFCKHDTLEQLINRSITNYKNKGQKEPATWIYEVYGNLVKHILLHLNLGASSILKNMTNYTITLEEAIRQDVFRHTKESKDNDWLEELYNYLIDEVNEFKDKNQTEQDIVDMFVILIKEYNLTKEEYQILWNAFEKYIKTMKEYQKTDVGLETNIKVKIEKIKKYNLDEVEIEESFYIPLEFDKGVLLGRQSELYKRRQLLRQYTIDWDYYTEVEKEQIKLKNNFTDEEILYIEKTRDEINTTINTIKR